MFVRLFATILLGAAVGVFAAAVTAAPVNPKVLMKTTKGDMTIELFEDKAPLSVKNFLTYADEKFYDGTIFHRVIPDFMVQGGGYTAEMHEKASKPPIKNEAKNGLKNLKGTLAMARTEEIHSATCQFFINTEDNPDLDHKPNDPKRYGYAVFGKVIAGMEVLEAIRSVKTGVRRGHGDVPREPILILSVERLKAN